ncbi:MAG: 30S ribosomal protein S20 [Planctomycetota bacterium]|jgi:small subunit ribosomal protein S20|nr:30S ribosomal protein S20 [Planctomycetota bacterium]
MPNIESAKKRMRQSVKRTARNRVRKEKLKKAVRGFRTVLAGGDAAALGDGLKKVSAAIDKAKVKGILHKNTASRRISRLAKAANRAAAAIGGK